MTNKNIGSICRKIRVSHGYTLNQLGEKFNRNMKTLSAFEQGRSTNLKILIDYLSLLEDYDRIRVLNSIMEVNENND